MRLPTASAIVLALNAALVPGYSQTATPVQPISLEQAVRRALEDNLALAAERFTRDTAREALVVAEAAYDPTLSLTARKTVREEANPASELSATSSDTERVSLSASQRIDTGATVTLTGNNQRQETNRFSTFNPQYDSDVSLRVVQPLTNGAGIAANRAARRRALLGVDRSDITFATRALDVIQSTELAFYDLAFARRQLEVQRTGLAAAQKFLEENEARQRAGLATELDVMQARVGVANRRSQILTAEQRVDNAVDSLLALLGVSEFQGSLEPQGIVFGQTAQVDLMASYQRAIEQDPEIRNANLLLRQLELDVRLARNQRLPRADLGGTLGYNGRNDEFYGAANNLIDGNSYNWQVDLTVTVPWGMREGRSRLRTALFTAEQQRARIRQLEQNLLVSVRSAVRAVETSTEAVAIAALSTELSAREYQLEKAKFDAGLSTSRLVVEAQQREDEARVQETQTRIQLKQNEARLQRVEGSALQRYGVDLFGND
ncbi:AdeC/AdeK/OprM family multidrug efflux complex outer membrane factor [Opitutales bacterium ASA1]|uniref:TolC family protein n=1 Tax=Congregicoccus parvus TaxID=3081749 RepID=UPI002B2A0DB2|nr:AdeC/AdeK/OprM family multidrug efflux complex outer membrane factor [Opitutales bacterium ASA1]